MATRSPFLRPSDFRTLANFDTSISNGEGLDFARFARPDDGRLVATGGGDVAIEAVVGEVDLATGEPFRPGTTPFEHLVPSLEPVDLTGDFRPVSLRDVLGLFDTGARIPPCSACEHGTGTRPTVRRRESRSGSIRYWL